MKRLIAMTLLVALSAAATANADTSSAEGASQQGLLCTWFKFGCEEGNGDGTGNKGQGGTGTDAQGGTGTDAQGGTGGKGQGGTGGKSVNDGTG